MSEVTGSVFIEFNTSGNHKFTFKGEIDPLYIWTLGIQLKQAYDLQYILIARENEVKNQRKKQLENAARLKQKAKEKLAAEESAQKASDEGIKKEREAHRLKKEEVSLLNRRTEYERILEKAKKEEAPNTEEIEEAIAVLTKEISALKSAPIEKESEKKEEKVVAPGGTPTAVKK